MSFVEGEITVEFGGTVGPAGPAGNAVPIAANTVLANPTGSTANPVGVDAAGMRTLMSSVGYVSQTLTDPQQKVARENIDAEQSVVDCTKAPFNCDPTGVADSTAGLNDFFAYISANDAGSARCHGTFLISNTINIGPTSGDMATKLVEGAMRVVSADATIGTVLLFRYMRDLVWKGIVKVEGWGNTAYTSRKNTTGVKFFGVNACNFDGFVIADMLGDGVLIDSTGVIPSYNNTIGIVWVNNCGSTGLDASVGVDQTTISGTWSARSDTGSSGGFDQRSTITLSGLPPASVDNLTKTILINNTPYIVKSINRGASTATIYPWINPIASTSGTYKFIFGAGVRTFGTEVAGNTIHHLSPTLCGYGLSIESLYGTTVGILQTHGCGAGMSVGGDVADALLGTHVARYYGEDINKFEFILRTLGAQSVTLSSMAPAEVDKIRTCCAPFVTSYSAPSSVYNNFPGCSFGLKDDPVITFKPINNSESLDGAAFLDVSTEKHVGYYGNNFTVNLVLADTGYIQYLGQDTFSFKVFGTGTNGSPTGTITINPPTGWKINGGTINAAATFSLFSGPATFAGYMQLSDMNIVVGKDFSFIGGTGSNDNRILRSDGTGGASIQASQVAIDDAGNFSGVASIANTGGIVTVNGHAFNADWIDTNGTFFLNSSAGLRINTKSFIRSSSSSGVIELQNELQNNFNRLVFGLVDSFHPSLKRNGAKLDVRLADDSANADLEARQITTSASTTSRSSLRIPQGVAPTSPVDGDIWTTSAGLFVRINGSTVGPLS